MAEATVDATAATSLWDLLGSGEAAAIAPAAAVSATTGTMECTGTGIAAGRETGIAGVMEAMPAAAAATTLGAQALGAETAFAAAAEAAGGGTMERGTMGEATETGAMVPADVASVVTLAASACCERGCPGDAPASSWDWLSCASAMLSRPLS
jgi:hypothetical protein